MLTQVVVLGRGAPGPAATGPGDLLVHHVDDDGGLPDRLEPGRHTLVLAERQDARVLGRVCATVAVEGDRTPVAGRALPVGPLALRVLARLAARQDVPPACVVAWVEAAAAATWSGAWLPGVAGLASPSPSLAQHARGVLPGGQGYLVVHGERPRVVTVKGDRRVAAVQVAGGEGLPAPAAALAASLVGDRHLVAHGPSAEATARYGSPDAVELAALPVPLPTASAGDGLPSCVVCALPVPQDACPFCRAVPVHGSALEVR